MLHNVRYWAWGFLLLCLPAVDSARATTLVYVIDREWIVVAADNFLLEWDARLRKFQPVSVTSKIFEIPAADCAGNAAIGVFYGTSELRNDDHERFRFDCVIKNLLSDASFGKGCHKYVHTTDRVHKTRDLRTNAEIIATEIESNWNDSDSRFPVPGTIKRLNANTGRGSLTLNGTDQKITFDRRALGSIDPRKIDEKMRLYVKRSSQDDSVALKLYRTTIADPVGMEFFCLADRHGSEEPEPVRIRYSVYPDEVRGGAYRRIELEHPDVHDSTERPKQRVETRGLDHLLFRLRRGVDPWLALDEDGAHSTRLGRTRENWAECLRDLTNERATDAPHCPPGYSARDVKLVRSYEEQLVALAKCNEQFRELKLAGSDDVDRSLLEALSLQVDQRMGVDRGQCLAHDLVRTQLLLSEYFNSGELWNLLYKPAFERRTLPPQKKSINVAVLDKDGFSWGKRSTSNRCPEFPPGLALPRTIDPRTTGTSGPEE